MAKPSIIKTSENPLQTIEVEVYDEYGEKLVKSIACERPLTVLLNWKEIVTLMTLGSRPEALVLGYLKTKVLFPIRKRSIPSSSIGKLIRPRWLRVKTLTI